MEVLKYGNRKQDDQVYDISTPEKEQAAYLVVFRTLDGDWGAYADLNEIEPLKKCEPCEKDLHRHCEEDNCNCTDSEECKKRSRGKEYEHKKMLNWKQLYDKAKQGDAEAAKKLIQARSANHYEYEEIELIEVLDPIAELKAQQEQEKDV